MIFRVILKKNVPKSRIKIKGIEIKKV